MSHSKINLDSNSNPESLIRIKKIQLCQPLQKYLQDIAIRRIGADVLRAIRAIQRIEYKEAQNRINVSHGLFGLSLDSFYARLKATQDTVHFDVLTSKYRADLEQAKYCIVIDDVYDFVRNIFAGYENQELEPILKKISDSQKLLKVGETIALDFQDNSDHLKEIENKLNVLTFPELNAFISTSTHVHAVKTDCAEAEFIVVPINYRYSMSFYNRSVEQSVEKVRQIEENLEKTLRDIKLTGNRENIVSDSILMKQRNDIEMLKVRLNEMTELYDREYEIVDGQIAYKTNAIDTMREQYKDCIAKLEFYKSDIGRLREWQEMKGLKKIENPKVKNPKVKKGKKKNKSKLIN